MNIWFNGGGTNGNDMWAAIWNGNSDGIEIAWIHVYWPDPPNGVLNKVRLNGDTIWEDGDDPPDAWITSFISSTYIPDFSTGTLEFNFQNEAQFPPGYWIEVSFTNGCYISGGA